ncbi:MAG: GIY-YIG nuclease family protein [Alphaproteobacteria bacterium]
MKEPAVYIMANQKNGTLYTGVTSDLVRRVYEHKNSIIKGFTSQHSCKMLVFYELLATMEVAINREKQIKSGSRARKIKLIEANNPEWRDLYEEIFW